MVETGQKEEEEVEEEEEEEEEGVLCQTNRLRFFKVSSSWAAFGPVH